MKTLTKYLFIASINFLLLAGSIQQSAAQQTATRQPLTSLSKEVKEIQPGILQGYLSKDELPNSLKLLPPPPKEGSAAFQLDQAIAAKYIASHDEARKDQAAKDAVLAFPQATGAFNIILNVKISKKTTPHLYMILRRTLADAGLSTYAAKNYYQRKRPFMVNNAPTCTPEEEKGLRKDGSYPSGHAAIGWAWALILSEVFPKQADVILKRGYQFGISRIVCNVHWYSDVAAGRTMGVATVAVLHSNPDFINDMKAAKAEIRKLKEKQ